MNPGLHKKERKLTLVLDAAKLWGGAIAEQVFAFGRGIILPRALGPGLYGILSSLGMILQYGVYLQLGLTSAAGREIPAALAAGDRARADAIARSVYSFTLLASSLAALGLAAFALITWGRYRAEVSWGLIAFAFLLVTARYNNFFETIFQARRQFNSSFAFTALRAAVTFGCVVGLLYARRLYGVYIGLVASGILFLFIGSLWTKTWAAPWPDWKVIRGLLKVALPFVGISALGFVLQSFDRLVVISFFPVRAVGQYMLATTIVTFIYFIPMNIGQAMAPRIYALARDPASHGQFEEYLGKPSLLITYAVAGIGGLAVLCLIPFIRYVMPAYAPTVSVVAALLVGITCQGGAQGAGYILIALGRFRSIALAQVISLAVGLLAAAAAIRLGAGLLGVAISSSLALMVYACALQIMAARLMELSPWKLVNSFAYLVLPPAAVAGALVAAFYPGTRLALLWKGALVQPWADLSILAARIVIFVPTVLLFGFYVEHQTGFVAKTLNVFREKISQLGK